MKMTDPKFVFAARAVTAAVLASTASLSAHALLINATFDTSVGAAAQAAFNFAKAEFEAKYSDPVTVNINVRFGVTGLGASSTALQFVVPDTYAKVRSDLAADQAAHPSTPGATSVAPGGSVNTAVDPTSGGHFLYTFAQAKALGARGAFDPAVDGTITFSNAQPFTFGTTAAARGTGGFDFVGVAEHEIAEVMGKINGLDADFCGGSCPHSWLVFDLFRFTGAGTRGLTAGAGKYYSFDNGTTNLHGFNANPGGDSGDWDASDPTDPFNAFTGPNQAHSLNATDFTTLDVIGWDLISAVTPPVPEPMSLALVLASLGGMSAVRRRRNAKL